MANEVKVLTGSIVETTSSDSCVVDRVEEANSSYYGTRNRIGSASDVTILEPGHIVNSETETVGDASSSVKITLNTGTIANDSPYQIFEIRIQKIVAVEINDRNALNELKKAA